MTTINQQTPVLLVVDVQNGVVRHAWERDRVVGKVREAVEKARANGVPVVWVQHSGDELVHGSADWEWVPELAPADDETLIHKTHNSAFADTPLADMLAEQGATEIALAGAATNACIRATAYAALERGYNLTLLKDAHTTEDIAFQDGVVVPAEHIIRDLNVAMRWLSYPNVVNRDVAVAEWEPAGEGARSE